MPQDDRTYEQKDAENKARIAEGLRKHLWPMFADGRLRVIVHQVFPFEEVVAAHRMMESGQHFGKLLLRFR
jgi:NADPH:quinone reductase-like Zn-dependent oxidoreductase